MPTYEYACTECGHRFDVVQSFSDEPLTTCPECGGALRKVFSPVGIVLKGSGFYKTDSRTTGPKGSSGKDRGAGDAPADRDGKAADGSKATDGSTTTGAGTGSAGSDTKGAGTEAKSTDRPTTPARDHRESSTGSPRSGASPAGGSGRGSGGGKGAGESSGTGAKSPAPA
jgi:putative FmdB family regulatory protein